MPPCLRFRVRTLMVIVALAALLMGSVGPGRRWYRRWSYHRSQATLFARLEGKERLESRRGCRAGSDREAISAG